MSNKLRRVVSAVLLSAMLTVTLPLNTMVVHADTPTGLSWTKDNITAQLRPIAIAQYKDDKDFQHGIAVDEFGVVWYAQFKSTLAWPAKVINWTYDKIGMSDYIRLKPNEKVTTYKYDGYNYKKVIVPDLKVTAKDEQGNSSSLTEKEIIQTSTDILALTVKEMSKDGSKALKHGDWLVTLIDMNGGLSSKVTADNDEIKITTNDNEDVFISVKKDNIYLYTPSVKVSILNQINNLTSGEQTTTYSDGNNDVIVKWNGSKLYNLLSVMNNFEQEYASFKTGSTKSTVADGIDESVLSLPDDMDYAVYKKASGALNKYAKDGTYESFASALGVTTKSWEEYSPGKVDLSALKPSGLSSDMKANLWLQLELFKKAVPTIDWTNAGSYSKVTDVGSATNYLSTEDISNAVKEVVDSNKGFSSVANQNNIALSYESLVKYVSAKLDDAVSVGNTQVSDNGEVDAHAIANNSQLDALSEVTYENADTIQPKITSTLPIPKRVPQVSGDKVETYYNLVYYTLVTDANMTSSFLRLSGGAYVCDVGEELKQMAGSRDEEYLKVAQLSSKQSKFVRTVLGFKEGMDYLGIDNDYCDSAKLFCSYYDTCLKFKDNTNVSQYDMGVTGEPLKMFFSASDELLSDYYMAGVAVSSSYIPLQTNMYSPASMALMGNENFIKEFHYKYGFYRKALFIDNSKASAVDSYITELKGTQRIATLKDLFQPESDIVLYVDNNFYNADVLADKQGYIFDAMRNTEASDVKTEIVQNTEDVNDGDTTNTGNALNGLSSSMVNKNDGATKAQQAYEEWTRYFRTLFDVDFENIVKTASANEYSVKFFQGTTKYGKENFYDLSYDKAIWDDISIDSYLDEDEYSVAQSYAVVSGIYKNTDVFNIIQRQSREMKPVFISSPTLAAMESIDQEQFNTIYNYLMLKNLENNLSYDYKSTLDMNSPIFIDIYGNIITESGLVVIPAASNATLVLPEMYTPWTAGFLSLYAGEYHLEETYNNSTLYLPDYFEVVNGEWRLKAKTINGVYMNFTYLPIQAEGVLDAIVSGWNKNIAVNNGVDFEPRAYLITEVLRGAPLEDIDYVKEGIESNRAISKVGLSMAYKLDDLVKQFLSDTNGNSLITLPNLAFMEGVEYIILFVFKIIFAALMLGIILTIYKDTISGTFGVKSIIGAMMSVVLTVMGVVMVPDVLDWSYYSANKNFLKDDISYVAMLNLEKKDQGKEIGIGEIIEPQTSTELYVKLDDISVEWYNMFDDVLLADTFDTMTEVYDQAFENNPFSQLKYVQKKANGLYVSLEDIYGSSTVGFSIGTKMMYQSVTEPNIYSYSSPYYVILDQLIANVNAYNMSNNILNYTTDIARDGTVKTKGMISSYFLSEYFMGDNYDITGLHTLYEDDSQKILTANPFSADEIEQMKLSAWYPDFRHTKEVTNVVDELEYYAKSYVEKNRSLLNKVSDETFLKIMATQIALEHNRTMKVGTAQAIEIFNIDSRDLLRLMVNDKASVFKNSSYSFARYVYEDGGTFAVILMGCLTAVIWLSSVLKPAFMIVIMALLVISLICRKILFSKQSRAYEGYFISMGCLAGCNLLYALMLKVSISLPDAFGATSAVSISIGLFVQVVYVLALLKLMSFQIKDWKNIGFNEYQKAGVGIVEGISNIRANITDKFLQRKDPIYRDASRTRRGRYNRYTATGQEILNEMHERDVERKEDIWDNPV